MNQPEQPVSEPRTKRTNLRRKGIYLLPNAITISSLFCGFYAIVMSLNLEFKQATVAIFISMILDSMDGRVARLTRTQSEFGAELDSLADMVAFGAAPALVVYEWSGVGLRFLCVCRLETGPVQYQHCCCGQALFSGIAQSCRGSAGSGIYLVDGRHRFFRQRFLLDVLDFDPVRRSDYGVERSVLQFQGHEYSEISPVYCRHFGCFDFCCRVV